MTINHGVSDPPIGKRDPRRVAKGIARLFVAVSVIFVLLTFTPLLAGVALLVLLVVAFVRPNSRARGVVPLAMGFGLIVVMNLLLRLLHS